MLEHVAQKAIPGNIQDQVELQGIGVGDLYRPFLVQSIL